MGKNKISIFMIIFTSFFMMVGCNVGLASEPTQTPTETATLTPIPPTATATVTPTATLTPTPTVTFTPTLGIGSTQVSPKDGMVLVYVPEGEFLMGSTEADIDKVMAQCSNCKRKYFNGELPQHKVYLDAYWIDQTEVTNAVYTQCVADGECEPPQDKLPGGIDYVATVDGVAIDQNPRNSYNGNPTYADYPVIYVEWNQANAYCGWAGRRLPSEAEWEKAARGTDGRTYPWGEGIDCDKANYNGKDGSCMWDTRAVGSYPQGASVYGALDMVGNVSEWWLTYSVRTTMPIHLGRIHQVLIAVCIAYCGAAPC